MKTTFKKLLSVILAVVMLLSMAAVAASAAAPETPVIVVSGMGYGPLYKEDGTTAFPMSNEVLQKGIAEIIVPLLGSVLTNKWEFFAQKGIKPIYEMFEPLKCDKDGNSVYPITTDTFPLSTGNYAEFKDGITNERGIVRAIAEKTSWDTTYFFYYDWRMNPLDIADDLHTLVKSVKQKTGSDKVSFIAGSFGGMILSSYMYKYGTNDIKNAVYASTAFQGVDLVGQMYSKGPQLTLSAVMDYLTSSMQGKQFIYDLLGISTKILATYGVVGEKAVNNYVKNMLKILEYPAYSEVFSDTFAAFGGIWCLMPAEYYKASRQKMGEVSNQSDKFYAKVEDYLFNVQSKTDKIFDAAEKNGVNIYVVGANGFAGIPLTASSVNHTDNLIDTARMTGGAVVAPYGKTLDSVNYSKDGFCTKHNHVSTDNVIDAGGCLLPERTWFINGMTHMGYTYGTYSMNLLVWIATSANGVDVHTSADYPQFARIDGDGTAYSLTEGVKLPGDNQGFTLNKVLAVFRKIVDRVFDLLQKFYASVNDFLAK